MKGSGYINRQCCGNTEIELGTVYAAEMGISLYLDIDRYTLEEAEIRLSFHLVYEDETEEEVPMGVFYVAEANRCIKTLELKAYDGMLNLDKNFSKGLSSAYPYEFLSLLSKACHIELAQTKEEIEAMPNGTELLGIYQDNDIESWRDFLYYLAQTLGCFAIIDRFGRLNLSAYGNTAVMAVDIRHRFSSSFSDFVTRYTAVSSTNKRTEKAEYYAKSPDDGLTMNLGVNPLLQFGLEETRKRIINAILDVITSVEYVPFDSDTIGNPALDLGDVLRFTGGHADETKQSAITSIYTKINGKQTVKCVGKNPRLAAAKSKNDKNITGLINSIGETKLSIYTFANALALDVGAEKLSIINMEFASGDETNAEFHAQAILQVESNPDTRTLTAETTIDLGTTTDDNGTTVENKKVISFPLSWDEDGKTELSVFYVLDGHEVEEFHPKESWLSGKHLLTLYYPIMELTANQLHTFEVLISMKNGAGHIEAQNIMATITGQGLGVQERWDGKITAEETMKKLLLSSMPTHTLQDVVMVHFLSPKKTGLNDHVASISLIGMPMRSMKDTLRLFAPIVRDVVETDDKKKMNYKKEYVLAEDVFRLRKDYALSGNSSIRLDRGRMLKLVIPTENFDSLTALTIQPFETFPFINMEVLYPGNLSFSELTEQVGDAVKLKTSFSRQVSGQNQKINRGRLAAFSMGIGDMADIEELEVSNV
ncbi:hypothetical protein [Clostridium sp. AF35-15]|uniref:hypothetical protein n=1 Tax=Clostridium sp. AF35-15 TaxID=2293013 RepID=UPI001A9A4A11|nr:hypothetical protein [Clostridium sp. AF35-15]